MLKAVDAHAKFHWTQQRAMRIENTAHFWFAMQQLEQLMQRLQLSINIF